VSARRRPRLRSLALAGTTAALSLALAARASAVPKFGTAPALPSLPALTLNGGAQTANATMSNFSVTEAAESGGWNITVAGQSGSGKSAVFARYCPKATCGSDKEGYVAGGATLPANSLTLNSSGASFTGGAGTAPAFQCSSACNADSASAVKIVSKAIGGFGGSTWKTSGFSATSLTLATPSTLNALPAGEVYRANVLWTLSTGP
jgi:hypothetical protein